MSTDIFEPLGGANGKPRLAAVSTWQPVLPVPDDAPAAPATDPKGRTPFARWVYRDAAGRLLGYVNRFNLDDGAKEFRPLTWCRDTAGRCEWRCLSWPSPRPLYGLDRLAAKPQASVILCEGEKAADAAARLLPDQVAVTSPNGAKSAGKADWTPLAGRAVTIWPDHDEAGRAYAETVARQIKALGGAATIIQPPADARDGWDAADAEADGWTEARVRALIAAAEPPASRSRSAGNGASSGAAASKDTGLGGRRPSQSAQILDLIADAELWHDSDRNAFATVPIGDGSERHFENMALTSKFFRIWLSGRFYDATGEAPGAQALGDVIGTLEARAIGRGACHDTWLRVAALGDRLYLDLSDRFWRCVEIDTGGWRLVEGAAPVKFLRSGAMRPLPAPEICEDGIERVLRPHLNIGSDADFRLICAWLVASLHPRGPFPILAVAGEQGSGKSFMVSLLRSILDPNRALTRAAPKDDRDLVVSAAQNWVLAFDNMSGVALWLSDALCRMSTGSGFATRRLHTDDDELVFSAARPIVLNGIPDLAGRPDLQDRTIGLTLPRIDPKQRKDERAALAAFRADLPLILGALLDGLVASVRNLPNVKLAELPRMSDFTRIAVAAAPGLGWHSDDFLSDYASARATAVAVSLDASPLAEAVRSLVEDAPQWEGTATELMEKLRLRTGIETTKARAWPKTPSHLSGELTRLAPALATVGIAITQGRTGHDRKRCITIAMIRPQD